MTPSATFDTKYYGRIREFPAGDSDSSPTTQDILRAIETRKADGSVLACTISLTEDGALLRGQSTGRALCRWQIDRLLTCSTIQHPKSNRKRLGLLKVFDSQSRVPFWHLFKYSCTSKVDVLSDYFRFVSFTAQLVLNDRVLQAKGRCTKSRAEILTWANQVVLQANATETETETDTTSVVETVTALREDTRQIHTPEHGQSCHDCLVITQYRT